jgi:hypothetical protein
MDESPQLPPKKDVANALLQGPSVFVHLDPRREGVLVPNWLRNQPQLVLQIGLNMAVRIPDLDVGDEGIGCTLSFNRSPFWCFMPWTAVYGLVGEDGRGMIWPDDVPSELAAQRPRPTLVSGQRGASDDRANGPKPALKPAAASKLAATGAESRGAAARKGGTRGDRSGKRKTPAAERPLAIVKDPSEPSREGGGSKKKLPPYLRVIK